MQPKGERSSTTGRGHPDRTTSDGSVAGFDERLAIIEEISLALNSTLDPAKLLEVILDSSIRYTGATTGSLALLEGDDLRIVAARGLGSNVEEEVRLKVGQGITGRVAESGKPINVPDVTQDDGYIMVKQHIRSELAVPLILEQRVVGVISVDSKRVANFTGEDLQLLSIVGTQAAQILDNARAFSDLRRKARQDETLVEVGQALGSALDFEELFGKLLEILARRCDMTRGFLVLAQTGSDELTIEMAYGMTPEEVAKGRYQRGEGIIGTVFRTGKPYGARDVRKDPEFLGRTGAFRSDTEPLSFFAVPIFLESSVVGVFGAVKVFPGGDEFSEELSFLQIIAGTLSQAVKIYRGVAQEKARLLQENRLLREELGTRYEFASIVGSSRAMQEVFSVIGNVAPTRSTVLIRGESGTGKELIAHAIHHTSPRAERPFVRVNCAAIPENLLEAELFGYVKGAFTGAIADRKGKFALADQGTIFLDEIGDMSAVLQAKILRVLQERELEVVGSEGVVKVDVRVLAATHRDLEELVKEGSFREDLYYRLNVVPVVVPPLRERLEDVRVLAHHFLERHCKENDLPELELAAAALRVLMRYSWPGNVRELENAIERAVVLCEGDVIEAIDLPQLGGPLLGVGAKNESGFGGSLRAAVHGYLDGGLGAPPPTGQLWDQTLFEVESALIDRALDQAGGVQLRAAELLGIHRNTLRKKLAERGGAQDMAS